MKRPVAALVFIITLLSVFTFSVSAAKYEIGNITFTANDEFTVHTADDLLSSSNVNGLLFVGLTADGNHQIQCRQTVTEFSKQLVSFAGMDAEIVAPIGQQIFPNGFETTVINSLIYLKNTTADDKGYTSVYVTVNDGKLYTFTYFGSDATKMGEFMTTVKFPLKSGGTGVNVYLIVLIAIFILADVVLIGFLGYSFFKDYRQRKMEKSENVVDQYIKIKRRKF
ncbi:MAG: hypothetical protein E7525_00455 [Ruminococcaceae bacterium]|nr:hypothetical protein [Oscillospiraceae bacterium]